MISTEVYRLSHLPIEHLKSITAVGTAGQMANNILLTRLADREDGKDTVITDPGAEDDDMTADEIHEAIAGMDDDQLRLLSAVCTAKGAALKGGEQFNLDDSLEDSEVDTLATMTPDQKRVINHAAKGHDYIPVAARGASVSRGIGRAPASLAKSDTLFLKTGLRVTSVLSCTIAGTPWGGARG